MGLPELTETQIEQIARIIGDTQGGLTGSEIGRFLAQCQMEDPDPEMSFALLNVVLSRLKD